MATPVTLVDSDGLTVGTNNPLVVSPGPSSAPSATNNTSTTALGSGQTFTGVADQNNEPDVMVSCHTDNSGVLYFDFSNNGTDWDTFPVNGFIVTSGVHEFHTAVKGGRYFRVRLVNDSGAQSFLRLYTYYGTFRHGNLPLNANIGSDADAVVVRNVNSELDLALGRFGGMSSDAKFGYITGLGTSVTVGNSSTWVDLWAYGGQRTSPTSSFTPYMASSSSSDTDIDVIWTYLDANGEEQEVTVATNASDGRTPVSLGVTATELYRGINDDSTDLVGNVSATTANNFTNGVPDAQDEVLASIPVNDNQSQVLAARVPTGKVIAMREIKLYLSRENGSDSSANVVLQSREPGKVWRTRRHFAPTTSVPVDEDVSDIVLSAGTDFRVRIRDISDSGSTVSGSISYFLADA